MNHYSRIASSNQFEIIPIAPPFSFFSFIDNRFPRVYPLRRILSQARLLNAKTMVFERVNNAYDLEEENTDIRVRFPDFNNSESFRLSFFTKKFATKRGFATAKQTDFIGYVIIKIDEIPSQGKKMRIYESVLPLRKDSNNCVRGSQKWICNILGNQFEVDGYIYAQQNNITNVCAHVALKTAAARYRDISYHEMNEIIGIDHIKRQLGGSNGINSQEMVKILETAGARCFVADYSDITSHPPAPFHKYIYSSIESGFPAIICFGTSEPDSYHAISVFGHMFNEDIWVPNADFSYFRIGAGTKYIPSESWLSMYIVHDDNWGSNYNIPRHYLHTNRICKTPDGIPFLCPEEIGNVVNVISTVPKTVKMSPIRAEAIGVDYLFTILTQMSNAMNIWGKRLDLYAQKNMLVIRTILVLGRDYIDHLEKMRDWGNKRIRKEIIQVLGEHLKNELFWLIELSIPELFSANKRKIGEVLIRSDHQPTTERDLKSFMMGRLSNNFIFYDGGGPSNPKYKFIPSGIDTHVELYGIDK
jgi:hypothetical protein